MILSQQEIEARVRAITSKVMRVPADSISLDSSPSTVPDWDSMRHLTLFVAVEESFGVEFEDDAIANLISVGAIIRRLGELLAERERSASEP